MTVEKTTVGSIIPRLRLVFPLLSPLEISAGLERHSPSTLACDVLLLLLVQAYSQTCLVTMHFLFSFTVKGWLSKDQV